MQRQVFSFDIIDQANDIKLYHEKGEFSTANPTYLHTANNLVRSMVGYGNPEQEIMVITFYTAQQRCYRRIFVDLPSVDYKTVDDNQGNERIIIIVNCVKLDDKKS